MTPFFVIFILPLMPCIPFRWNTLLTRRAPHKSIFWFWLNVTQCNNFVFGLPCRKVSRISHSCWRWKHKEINILLCNKVNENFIFIFHIKFFGTFDSFFENVKPKTHENYYYLLWRSNSIWCVCVNMKYDEKNNGLLSRKVINMQKISFSRSFIQKAETTNATTIFRHFLWSVTGVTLHI